MEKNIIQKEKNSIFSDINLTINPDYFCDCDILLKFLNDEMQ
jgi:hypothetical protein